MCVCVCVSDAFSCGVHFFCSANQQEAELVVRNILTHLLDISWQEYDYVLLRDAQLPEFLFTSAVSKSTHICAHHRYHAVFFIASILHKLHVIQEKVQVAVSHFCYCYFTFCRCFCTLLPPSPVFCCPVCSWSRSLFSAFFFFHLGFVFISPRVLCS